MSQVLKKKDKKTATLAKAVRNTLVRRAQRKKSGIYAAFTCLVHFSAVNNCLVMVRLF
jgi:hypothetical protein